jgi:hypothetical protein
LNQQHGQPTLPHEHPIMQQCTIKTTMRGIDNWREGVYMPRKDGPFFQLRQIYESEL